MKHFKPCCSALLAAPLVGCVQWHCAEPSHEQMDVPAWRQVQVGMPRQQVYALLGKPLREAEQQAAWRGPQIKKGWPSNLPATTYWREFEACFDAEGRVKAMRDYNQQQ